MKIHFRFFLSHVKLAKTQEKHSFIEFYYRFHCGKRANNGALPMTSIDELRRLSLSKCFPVLSHKLIYEIAIFHSINRETCDKYMYMYSIFDVLGTTLYYKIV